MIFKQKNQKLILSILLLFLHLNIYSSITYFEMNEHSLVGVNKNRDKLDMNHSMIWFYPASKEKFARVYLGWNGITADSGMNEEGLFFTWNDLEAEKGFSGKTDKKNYMGSVGQLILEKCSDVDEALSIINRYNISKFGFSNLYLADKSGLSAEVSWNSAKERMRVHRSWNESQVIGLELPYLNKNIRIKRKSYYIDKIINLLSVSEAENEAKYVTIFDLINNQIIIKNSYPYEKRVELDLKTYFKKGAGFYEVSSIFSGVAKPRFRTYFKELSSKANLTILIFDSVFTALMLISFFRVINMIKEGVKKTYNLIYNLLWGIASALVLIHLQIIKNYAGEIIEYGFAYLGEYYMTFSKASIVFIIAVFIFTELSLKFMKRSLKQWIYSLSVYAVYIAFIHYMIRWNIVRL